MTSLPTPVWASALSVTLSALSVLGGAAIAVGWFFSAQRSHLRQKLILGLGLSDFTQGVTTMIGSALQLSGKPYVTNSPACDGSGFVYQACVISNACWTLVIAATTFVTLVHPFSRLTVALESPWAFPIITAGILIVSCTPSIATTTIYDMVNAGGLCWLTAGTRRAQLTLFVPRAFALVVVITLYVRLFIFFRRRDVGMLDSTMDARDDDDEVEALGGKRLSVASLSARLAAWNRRQSSETIYQPAPQHTRPVPLQAIPGSPVQFNESFPSKSHGPTGSARLTSDRGERHSPTTSHPPTSSFLDDGDHLRESERKPSVTVSFSGIDAHSSSESSPDLLPDGTSQPRKGSSPPSSTPRSKRLSSGAISPGQVSGASKQDARRAGSAASQGGQPPPPSRPRRGSLTPRQVNKRLSLLMAVFPLAYCAIVAVAVARLIQELSTNERAPTALLWTSRSLINSMGAIDGILFVVVQWAFRAWVKRRNTA